jgi:hypothetical protein
MDKIIKILIILLVFLYQVQIYANEYLSNNFCKFELDIGYKNSFLYIRNHEAFVIIDGGDSRYGTISTVFNAINCEKIVSGEKSKSSFSKLLLKKGFKIEHSEYKNFIDSLFQNKISFYKNKKNIFVSIEPISDDVTQELKRLISNLSNKNIKSKIDISSKAKEIIGYPQFYIFFVKELNQLNPDDINIPYAKFLNNEIIANIHTRDNLMLLNQKKVQKKIALLKEQQNRILAKREATKRKKAINYHYRMISKGLEEFIENYNLNKIVRKLIGGSRKPYKIKWIPSKEWSYPSEDHSISGKGEIIFELSNSMPKVDYVSISGKFENSKLISNATIKVSSSVCLKHGFLFCDKQESASLTRIVSSKNLVSSIYSISSEARNLAYNKVYKGFSQKKQIGQQVCMYGNSLFEGVEVKAFVENINGNKIQLRITNLDSIYKEKIYKGNKIKKGSVIWDYYYNWGECK